MSRKSLIVIGGEHSNSFSRVLAFLATHPSDVFIIQNGTENETRDIVKRINADPNSRGNLTFVMSPSMIKWGHSKNGRWNFHGLSQKTIRKVFRYAPFRKQLIRRGKTLYFFLFRFLPFRPILLKMKKILLHFYFGSTINVDSHEDVLFRKISIEGAQLKIFADKHHASSILFINLQVELVSKDQLPGLDLLSINGPLSFQNLNESLAEDQFASLFRPYLPQNTKMNLSDKSQNRILVIYGGGWSADHSIKIEFMELLNIARSLGINKIDAFSSNGQSLRSNLLDDDEVLVTERRFYSSESEFLSFVDSDFNKYRFVIFLGFFSNTTTWVDFFYAASVYQLKVLVPKNFPHIGGALTYDFDVELDLRDKLILDGSDLEPKVLNRPRIHTLEQWLDVQLN
jgi:hypothetical protein